MMRIKPGQALFLQNENGENIDKIVVGLGWQDVEPKGPSGFFNKMLPTDASRSDLDSCCLAISDSGDVVDTIWFRQQRSQDGTIIHARDLLGVDDESYDEQFMIDLANQPKHVTYIVFALCAWTGQSLSNINILSSHFMHADTHERIAKFLARGSQTGNACIMCCVRRNQNGWEIYGLGDKVEGHSSDQLEEAVLTSLGFGGHA